MSPDPRPERATPDDFSLDDWLVQPSLNRVSRGDEKVQIEPKLMDVLAFLAAKAGEVVSKDDITDAVWTDRFITDSVVTRAIAALRRALHDDAHDPRYIETISKRGYRLIARLAEPPGAASPAAASPGDSPRPWQASESAVPFVVGQWVRGQRFYGRAVQIAEILDGNRNWLWLLGTRRVGKTSLLKQLEHLTEDSPEGGYFPIFWDLQGAESPAELHGDFADALLDTGERLERVGIDVADVTADDLFSSLGLLRRRLRAKRRKVLLLCDEVEELIQLQRQDPALLRKLRRAMQSREDIRSVLASSIRLWDLAEQKQDTSPFLHGFTPPVYLDILTDDEARALIRQAQLAPEDRPRFDDEIVEIIRDHCGNHPYLIQLLCKRFLELGDLTDAFDEVATDSMVSFFFSVDFELLTETERGIIVSIAERTAASSKTIQLDLPLDSPSLVGALNRLEHLGFIRRNDERRFHLVNYFFRRWLGNLPLTRPLAGKARRPRQIDAPRGLPFGAVRTPRDRDILSRWSQDMQQAAAAHPFVVGQWVRGEEFYGREALIEEILDGPRDAIWLLGTRRIGKTSLLKQLGHLTASGERGFFPLFWDFQGAETLEELSADFDDSLLDVEERLAELGIGLEEVRGRTLFTSLGLLRRRLRAKRRKLLLLCDEVEELIRLNDCDPALLRKLRHAMQSKEGIRSVLASSLKLWALGEQREDTSPFLHGFLPALYIQRLDAAAARSLIRRDRLAAGLRPDFGDESTDEICRRCAGHPYLLQLLAARCWQLGDLTEACEDVAADPTAGLLFAVDFDTLSAVEQGILRCVAERAPADSHAIRRCLQLSSGTLAGELQRLESLGFLDRDEDRRCTVANPFFRRWLRELPAAPTPGPRGESPGPSHSQHAVTAIVERVAEDAGGRVPEELLPLVYDELRRMARRFLARERPGHTLQATALVHDAYLKLVDQTRVSWQGRTHFLAVGARAMRRLLIDHARTRGRAKRGGDQQRVTLNEALAPSLGSDLDREQLLSLDAALEKLAKIDERRVRIVELRFFAGLTITEVAAHLGLSKRTVNTEWSRARAWLEQELSDQRSG